MKFAKVNGLDVYRLVAHKADGTYTVEDGFKMTLTLLPLETIEEALEFIHKDSVSRGQTHHSYTLVEN